LEAEKVADNRAAAVARAISDGEIEGLRRRHTPTLPLYSLLLSSLELSDTKVYEP